MPLRCPEGIAQTCIANVCDKMKTYNVNHLWTGIWLGTGNSACSYGCSSCIWLRTGASGDLFWTLVVVVGREQELVCSLVGISNCCPFCSCSISS